MAKMVQLARFVDRSEAIIARGLLEACGIVAVIPDIDTLGVAPHLVFAVDGYRVLVSERDLEAAREVLRQARTAASRDESSA